MLENDRVALPTLTVLFKLCDALAVDPAKIVATVNRSRRKTKRPG
jgi:hypothetical protein